MLSAYHHNILDSNYQPFCTFDWLYMIMQTSNYLQQIYCFEQSFVFRFCFSCRIQTGIARTVNTLEDCILGAKLGHEERISSKDQGWSNPPNLSHLIFTISRWQTLFGFTSILLISNLKVSNLLIFDTFCNSQMKTLNWKVIKRCKNSNKTKNALNILF